MWTFYSILGLKGVFLATSSEINERKKAEENELFFDILGPKRGFLVKVLYDEVNNDWQIHLGTYFLPSLLYCTSVEKSDVIFTSTELITNVDERNWIQTKHDIL